MAGKSDDTKGGNQKPDHVVDVPSQRHSSSSSTDSEPGQDVLKGPNFPNATTTDGDRRDPGPLPVSRGIRKYNRASWTKDHATRCYCCVKICRQICSFSPKVRKRNTKFILVLSGVMLAAIYTFIGWISLGQCPVQPVLPYYAIVTGIVLGVALPLIACGLAKSLKELLVRATNEDAHSSIWVGLKHEMSGFAGKLRVMLIVLILFSLIVWWVLGSYLIYAVYHKVNHPESQADAKNQQGENDCDAILFVITSQIMIVLSIIFALSLLWFAANICYDERFRRNLSELLRYEIVHSNQLQYDLHRGKERRSRAVRIASIKKSKMESEEQNAKRKM